MEPQCCGLFDDPVKVGQNFIDDVMNGVDFPLRVVTLFDELFEMAAGDLRGKLVGDDLAGARLLGDPGGVGQGDPHGAAVDIEADIHCIGVAGGDGHDGALPAAVKVFAAPAIGDMKVFVHVSSLSFAGRAGKGWDAKDWCRFRLGSSAVIIACQLGNPISTCPLLDLIVQGAMNDRQERLRDQLGLVIARLPSET